MSGVEKHFKHQSHGLKIIKLCPKHQRKIKVQQISGTNVSRTRYVEKGKDFKIFKVYISEPCYNY